MQIVALLWTHRHITDRLSVLLQEGMARTIASLNLADLQLSERLVIKLADDGGKTGAILPVRYITPPQLHPHPTAPHSTTHHSTPTPLLRQLFHTTPYQHIDELR